MKPYFLEMFGNTEDVFSQFDEPKDDSIEILLAYYNYEDYSGSAFVLFRQNGKLYEVNGGHCSCYGLEDQWHPEEVTLDALKFRINNGSLGMDGWTETSIFRDELLELIDKLEKGE